HVHLIGIGARNVKRGNAAGGTKRGRGDAGIEAGSRQRILAAQGLKRIRRHDDLQKTFFAADPAIAISYGREINSDTKAKAPAMATTFICLQLKLSDVIAEQGRSKNGYGRAGRTYSTSSPPSNPNCAGSRTGSGRPRWRNACAVISRPRGVRC